MDDFDKAMWSEVQEKFRQASIGEIEPVEHKKFLAKFWHTMLEKYPVLHNYKLAVDTPCGTIVKFGSNQELFHPNRGK